jgi:hypothetical protein
MIGWSFVLHPPTLHLTKGMANPPPSASKNSFPDGVLIVPVRKRLLHCARTIILENGHLVSAWVDKTVTRAIGDLEGITITPPTLPFQLFHGGIQVFNGHDGHATRRWTVIGKQKERAIADMDGSDFGSEGVEGPHDLAIEHIPIIRNVPLKGCRADVKVRQLAQWGLRQRGFLSADLGPYRPTFSWHGTAHPIRPNNRPGPARWTGSLPSSN